MQFFEAVVFRPELGKEDAERFPAGLRAIALRGPVPPGRADTGIILFGEAGAEALGRILEAVWLDRHFEARPKEPRKLYLVGESIYLQIGGLDNMKQVGGPGPIRGAIEGFRSLLERVVDDLDSGRAEEIPTPIGNRPAKHLTVMLPDPGKKD